MVENLVTKEHWTDRKWRPFMAWQYAAVCLFDFIVAPIVWSIIQASFKGAVSQQWIPLTLQGAGLYHIAMGAILGVAAWSRGQEKMTAMKTINSVSTFSSTRTSVSDDTDLEDADKLNRHGN